MPSKTRKTKSASQKNSGRKKVSSRTRKSAGKAAKPDSSSHNGLELLQKFITTHAQEDDPILLYGASDSNKASQQRDNEMIERFRRRLLGK